VKKALLFLVRSLFLMSFSFSVGFLAIHFGRQTSWYKDYLYHQLLTGNEQQRLRAAGALALVGGEGQLLKALQSETTEVHTVAQRGLEHLWFIAAGHKAYQMIEAAQAAIEKEDFQEALRILDRVTTKYPGYAEGWNQRGAVLWQMGQYQKSRVACERALSLNPNHYVAWQGLSVCQLHFGDVFASIRSLRAALKIAPHDETARNCLLKCEEFLRTCPPPDEKRRPADLL
jgi:tetratricopeptide (TPR) repeat protein